MNIINNKRADKMISVYWFAIVAIVSVGVFAMVYIYYGTPYDVRDIESNLMIDQLADCVSYAGKINTNIISGSKFNENTENFLKDCHLILTSGEWDEVQYYAEISFYKLENLNNSVFSIKEGNNKWLANCAIQETNEKERLAKCNQKKFYSIDDSNNQYIIQILTAVRKSEKNVKI
jgi:hypothetical protein